MNGADTSVIVPVFDEAMTVNELLNSILSQPLAVNVIIVDDGSTDGTADWFAAISNAGMSINQYSHRYNLGKAAAIRTGLAAASASNVLIQDADLEYDPVDYGRLLDCMRKSEAEVVYGSRFLKTEDVRGRLWWHTVGNRLLTRFANLVTGQSLTDEATGYKLFRREVLERMNLQEDGFGFCPEVTAKASRLGIKIYEVPISYHPRTKAEGKKIRLWHGLEALWCLVYYTWFDRSLEPGAPRKPPAALKEVVRPPVAPEPEAVPVK